MATCVPLPAGCETKMMGLLLLDHSEAAASTWIVVAVRPHETASASNWMLCSGTLTPVSAAGSSKPAPSVLIATAAPYGASTSPFSNSGVMLLLEKEASITGEAGSPSPVAANKTTTMPSP